MKAQIALICLAAVLMPGYAFVRREAVDDLVKKTQDALTSIASVTKDNVERFLNETQVQEKLKEIVKKVGEETDPNLKKQWEDATTKIQEFVGQTFDGKQVEKAKTDLTNVVKAITSAAEGAKPKLESTGKDIAKILSDLSAKISTDIQQVVENIKKE